MGEKMAYSLLDWFILVEKHKLERIKRAVHLNSIRKKHIRTIVDLVGAEDFEEYRDEIELEVRKA